MPAQTLQDLYARKLQELWSAEQQITVALPNMIARASHPELRAAFERHLAETQEQLQRLDTIFQSHGGRPGAVSAAMQGIVRGNDELLAKVADAHACDAALVAGAQAVEHHEIACYGTVVAWARQLGRADEAALLERSLREEEATDRLLTQLAESAVNREAMHGDRPIPMVADATHGDAHGTSPMTATDRMLLEQGPERRA